MKPLLVFVGALFAVSSTALATSIPTCVTNTLASYEALANGCEINNLLFDNFSDMESAATASALTPSEITVTPDFTLLDEGLAFNAAWSVATPAAIDSAISFTVQTVNGADTLDDISLSATETYTGNGIASVTENYCVGSLNGAGNHCPSTLQTISVSDPPALNNGPVTQTYGLTNELSVTKDIDVAATAPNSTATITVVDNNYSQIGTVPEPISLVLVGAGLLGVGLLRKRSRR
ncbi:MAG: PEP-CTERM sorting domain-containing protein [Bryobacteraceae bacterium]|jgi:hypothetical protein